MDLIEAPSWFQQHMATGVLAGLVYNICEIYIDDIIVYGSSEPEFINNIKAVLDRFRQYNMTLNPEKCKIGLSEI